MADAFLTLARKGVPDGHLWFDYGMKVTSTSFFRPTNMLEVTHRGTVTSRNKSGESTTQGLFVDDDSIRCLRLLAPTGQGDANDAFAQSFYAEQAFKSPNAPYDRHYIMNRGTGISPLPFGYYFRSICRIEDLNRSAIGLAFAGYGRRGNIAVSKDPLIAFIVEGTSGWKCRVDDDEATTPQVVTFDTGLDPTVTRFLEIVIYPKQTRFYVDAKLVFKSNIQYPPDTTATTDAFSREIGHFIDGDNASNVAMRFGIHRAAMYSVSELLQD